MRSWKHVVFAAAMSVAALLPSGLALGADRYGDEPVPIPLLTSPAYCKGEPADINRLFEIAGDAIFDPNATLQLELVPLDRASMATDVDANSTVAIAQQFVACTNANDVLRTASLLTDDFIVGAAYDLYNVYMLDSWSPDSQELIPPALYLGPLPADEQMRIAAASNVVQLPDGRFAFTFDLGPVTGESPVLRVQLIAIDDYDRFLIDDLRFQLLDAGYPNCESMDSSNCSDIPVDAPDCTMSDSDGCGPVPTYAPDCASDNIDYCSSATRIIGDGYTGWIMTADLSTAAASTFGMPPNGMEVSQEEIAEAEAALPDYARHLASLTTRLVDELNTGYFERQYFGYAIESNRLLVINGFCTVPFEHDASQDVISVDDGGDCFWHATYDLTNHEFISIYMNGFA
ncbi:hypothetical protein BH09CHL1_BH09CHL1_20310 [soil metagenome]